MTLSRISNYIHYKVWYKITYTFIKFKDVTLEIWEWIRNFIHSLGHVITYPCWEYSESMLVKGPLVFHRSYVIPHAVSIIKIRNVPCYITGHENTISLITCLTTANPLWVQCRRPTRIYAATKKDMTCTRCCINMQHIFYCCFKMSSYRSMEHIYPYYSGLLYWHRDGRVSQEDVLTHTWWRHQMETFCALLAICAGNSPVPGEFPAQRPVTRNFDVFFDLRLNKRWDATVPIMTSV